MRHAADQIPGQIIGQDKDEVGPRARLLARHCGTRMPLDRKVAATSHGQDDRHDGDKRGNNLFDHEFLLQYLMMAFMPHRQVRYAPVCLTVKITQFRPRDFPGNSAWTGRQRQRRTKPFRHKTVSPVVFAVALCPHGAVQLQAEVDLSCGRWAPETPENRCFRRSETCVEFHSGNRVRRFESCWGRRLLGQAGAENMSYLRHGW